MQILKSFPKSSYSEYKAENALKMLRSVVLRFVYNIVKKLSQMP